MKIQKEWCKEEFMGKESMFKHRELAEELAFYEAVKRGDVTFVKKNCEENAFANQAGMGILSEKPLTNIKYHFVITAAILTRICVEGGMELERAYHLSDFYITKMDKLQTVDEVKELHHIMVMDYTERMVTLRKENVISKPVRLCVDYIYHHLHQRITIKDLAEHTKLSSTYLSRIFKQEMHLSVSEYIRMRKIEEAENLLKHSDFSIVDIANYLAFPTESYFIQVFRKVTGMTPKKYRDSHYRNHK